jgi:hypothetical protein
LFVTLDLLRQERPGVRDDEIYAGMQERGRAIPPHTVPILEVNNNENY